MYRSVRTWTPSGLTAMKLHHKTLALTSPLPLVTPTNAHSRLLGSHIVALVAPADCLVDFSQESLCLRVELGKYGRCVVVVLRLRHWETFCWRFWWGTPFFGAAGRRRSLAGTILTLWKSGSRCKQLCSFKARVEQYRNSIAIVQYAAAQRLVAEMDGLTATLLPHCIARHAGR